jgi:hypothetical protein
MNLQKNVGWNRISDECLENVTAAAKANGTITELKLGIFMSHPYKFSNVENNDISRRRDY